MAKKSLSKEELIAQLKALSEDETPESVHMGAMCYSPAPPPHIEKCEKCGQTIEYYGWHQDPCEVKAKIKKENSLGDDVNIEYVCAKCASQLGVEKPLPVGSLYYVYKCHDQIFCYSPESNNDSYDDWD